MSRFFQQNSSSESDSESDIEVPEPRPRQIPTKILNYESEEEDNVGRVVIPEKAKRSEEINGLIKQLNNAKKIKDLVKANEVFEEMVKSYDKCKKIVEKEGHFKHYIRAISELETYVTELWADDAWKKSASKNNATALNKLRQRIRKYNKEYEKEITDFKSKPEGYPEEEKAGAASESESEKKDDEEEEESSEESSSEDDDDEKGKKNEDDDDESDWSHSESDESTTDAEIDYNQEDIWRQFLKDAKPSKDATKKEKKEKKKEKKRDKVYSDTESTAPVKSERQKLFAKDEEVNVEAVVNKLNHICSARGRKGTDRKEQMEMMTELREICKEHLLGAPIDVKILFNQIAINFDYNPRLNKCMKTDSWNAALRMLEEILDILMKNENIELSETVSEDQENFSEKNSVFKIKGCVLTMADRMIEEYVRILQQCDAHGTEYVERLKDEPKICALIDRLQVYLERKGDKQELCRIYLKKIENIYYKYDKNDDKKSTETIDKLCKYIYTNDTTDRLRTKAMLCHIYYNALHDRWFEARDLMLMSHLQESIDSSDIPLQILYNRTMVQVGLCAFRVGNIKESHAALLDIQSGNRAKELLAQGMMIQRNTEKTKEQEMKERQRLIPFHMHINLELIECMYLVSAMLIEVPYMSSRDYETKKRLISKQFHYQLKLSERQPVVGPPENMREHVVAASRAMRNGDWRGCLNYLINDKMNAKVWDLIPKSQNVKSMLTDKVKEETLRTYLFKYSSVYESMNIDNLAEMFDLPKSQVYSSISKMIINEELMASLDEPTGTVVMHRTEPTKLQTLALQLSEKINTLMDHTERIAQLKSGEMGNTFNRNQQGQQSQQNQQSGNYKQQQNWNKGGNKGNKGQNRQQRNQHHHHHHHQQQHQQQKQQQQQQHQHQQQQQQQQNY